MSTPSSSTADPRPGPARAVVLGAVLNGVILVLCARRLWFFGDDWDFLLHRAVLGDADRGLLEPHNGHWSTGPILVFRAIFAVVGLGHYLPYAVPVIVVHLVIGVLLFSVLRSTGVSDWIAALVALIVLFLGGGVGGENTLWDFQLGFLGPAALGLVSFRLLAHGRGRRGTLVGASGALVVALTFSGTALVVAVWVGSYALLAHGRRSAAIVVGPAVLTYAGWFLLFGRGHYMPHGDLRSVPLLFVRGIDSIWSNLTSVPGTGWLVLALLVAAVVADRGDRAVLAMGAASIIALALAYVLFSYAGTRFGPSATGQSRYWYYGILLSAPPLAFLLDRASTGLRGRLGLPVVAWVGALVLSTATGLVYTARWSDQIELSVENLPEITVASEQLQSEGEQLLGDRPEPRLNPDLTLQALSSGAGSTLPELTPSRDAELDARLSLQVSISSTPPDVAEPSHSLGQSTVANGCSTREAAPDTPFAIRVPASGLHTRLQSAQDALIKIQLSSGDARSSARSWTIRGGRPEYLASTAAGFVLEISVVEGEIELCHPF
jgi:hypothetical protein